jgi:4-hydroxy-tetrahydrodipicolinate synthase
MEGHNLRGTGVAMVTPFDKKGDVDHVALTRLVKHLQKGKVDYLVVLGTTGETATLDKTEKAEVVETVIKANGNKLPLVIGIGGNNTAEVASSIRNTDLKPFEAVLSVAPYYNKPNQEGYYRHYKEVSAAAGSKPVILYNVPPRTGGNINWETQVRIAKDFKNIVATKEASGNMDQIMKIIRNRPRGFMVISGDDNLTLPLIAAGGEGVISVVANAFPSDYSEMVRLCLKHKFDAARKLHYGLVEITDQLFADGNPGGVKHALHVLKICGPELRLPLAPPVEKVRLELERLIKLRA